MNRAADTDADGVGSMTADAAAGPDPVEPAGREGGDDGVADPGPFAVGPVLAIAAVTVAVMVVGSARYGYHRDELYYLWGGEHLDWGFVDHPPLVPLLARVLDLAGGHTLVPLRAAAAAVVGWLVVAGALIARELGGGRRAQALAAFAIAVTPATRAPEGLFGTTAFDAAVWAVLLLLAVRLLRTGRTRLWIAFGLVTGIGLETKWSVGLLVASFLVAVAVSDQRRLLRSPWLVVGGALAVALWLPNLWWNAANGWPALEFQRSVAEEHGTIDQRLLFLPMQLLLTGLATVVVWGPGLVGLVRGRLGERFRPVGYAAVILAAAVLVAGGKPYYVAPMYVALFAAGAVVVERAGAGRLRSCVVVLAVVGIVSVPATLPVLPPSALAVVEPINPELGEMVGWPELAATAEAAYADLPADERDDAIILTTNYGNAAAILRDAPDLPVYSGHNSLWFEGPPPTDATTVVAVGFRAAALDRFCSSVDEVAVFDNPAGDANDEHGRPVSICRGPARPWPQLWEELRHFE